MGKFLPVPWLPWRKGRVPVGRAVIEASLLEEGWPWEAGKPLTTYYWFQMVLLA